LPPSSLADVGTPVGMPHLLEAARVEYGKPRQTAEQQVEIGGASSDPRPPSRQERAAAVASLAQAVDLHIDFGWRCTGVGAGGTRADARIGIMREELSRPGAREPGSVHVRFRPEEACKRQPYADGAPRPAARACRRRGGCGPPLPARGQQR